MGRFQALPLQLARLMKLKRKRAQTRSERVWTDAAVLVRICLSQQSNFICQWKLKQETLLDATSNGSSGAQSPRRRESNTMTAFRRRENNCKLQTPFYNCVCQGKGVSNVTLPSRL